MQNPIISSLSYHANNDITQYNQQDMEDHFNNLLSQTHSRYTAAQTIISQANNQQAFHSSRMFVMSTLQSWGMKIGILKHTKDNQITLKCILQLISQKHRDIEYKMKVKQQLNSINFEKDKYQSFLKQSKNTISEKDKLLGKYQNQCTQLRKKIRLIQTQTKKQKTDDQKMIFMLKSKNQQILHQIKKKQVQVTKIKQQMKRNVIAKSSTVTPNHNKTQSPLHNQGNIVKNSFQLIQKIQRINNTNKQSKWKKNATQRMNINQNYQNNFQQEKWSFMVDKYQKEKKNFSNQNAQLRNKIFQIRQILMKFAQWIDVQLFGQTLQQTQKLLSKKFICNHNLMFTQNLLVNDLTQIINEAKNGIQQLQQRLIKTQVSLPSSKSMESPYKSNKKVGFTNQSSKSINVESNTMFKKKSASIREVNTPGKSSPLNTKSLRTINLGKQSQKQIKIKQIEKVPEPKQRSKQLPVVKSPQIQKSMFLSQQYGAQSMPSQIRPSKSNYINELQLSAFEHDLLSDIHEHSGEDPDNSIVSHISTSQLLKQVQRAEGKYDKWDILFHTEGEQEQQ